MSIPVVWLRDESTADWRVVDPAGVHLPELVSAIVISLMTDRRAEPSDALPDPSDGDRRGVWFDPADPEAGGGTEVALDRIGSRLWLVWREKATEEARARIVGYCREALAWLVADGVASGVDVASEWLRAGALAVTVSVVRSTGGAVDLRFEHVWSDTDGATDAV